MEHHSRTRLAKDINNERVALLHLAAAQIQHEEHFCPLCIRRNKSFFILCCSAFTILTIGIIFIIIRVPEVRPNLPTDILLTGWIRSRRSQMLDRLRVNLDDPPEDRWKKIGQMYAKYGQDISDTVRILKHSSSYYELLKIANRSNLEEVISTRIHSTILREVKGYARHLNVSYEDLIIFNLLFPHLMHNDISIVSDGQVWQRVYLANAKTANILKFNREIVFYKSGKMVFKTINGIGLVGAPIGVRLKGFSLSLSLKIAPDDQCDYANSSYVSTLAMRQVLSECHSYDEAMEYLRKSHFAGNFVLGGIRHGEVVVIRKLCGNDVILTSAGIHKENPVYTIQMTASNPSRFEAFCWTF